MEMISRESYFYRFTERERPMDEGEEEGVEKEVGFYYMLPMSRGCPTMMSI